MRLILFFLLIVIVPFAKGQDCERLCFTDTFKITKIKKVRRYYYIYAENDSLKYKIVTSRKPIKKSESRIEKDCSYRLTLCTMFQFNGKKSFIGHTNQLNGIKLEKDCVWDLFYCEDISGLNIKKDIIVHEILK